jgi:hypothetical protein
MAFSKSKSIAKKNRVESSINRSRIRLLITFPRKRLSLDAGEKTMLRYASSSRSAIDVLPIPSIPVSAKITQRIPDAREEVFSLSRSREMLNMTRKSSERKNMRLIDSLPLSSRAMSFLIIASAFPIKAVTPYLQGN